jgi:hypothetical protein
MVDEFFNNNPTFLCGTLNDVSWLSCLHHCACTVSNTCYWYKVSRNYVWDTAKNGYWIPNLYWLQLRCCMMSLDPLLSAHRPWHLWQRFLKINFRISSVLSITGWLLLESLASIAIILFPSFFLTMVLGSPAVSYVVPLVMCIHSLISIAILADCCVFF